MTGFPAASLLPLTLAATTLLLGACGDDSTPSASEAGESSTSAGPPAPAEPVEMKVIPAGTPLDPATYAMPFLGIDATMRAVVDVPDGYFSAGGWFIDDGHENLAPHQYGNLAFWGAVDQVDPDPCQPGPVESVGSSVQELADALTAERSRDTSAPLTVTLGGYDGLYLESRARGDLDRCLHGRHTMLRARAGDSLWLADGIPGTTDRVWIVNVNGHRVVAVVQTMRGKTDDPAELVGIARSVEFSHVSELPDPNPSGLGRDGRHAQGEGCAPMPGGAWRRRSLPWSRRPRASRGSGPRTLRRCWDRRRRRPSSTAGHTCTGTRGARSARHGHAGLRR